MACYYVLDNCTVIRRHKLVFLKPVTIFLLALSLLFTLYWWLGLSDRNTLSLGFRIGAMTIVLLATYVVFLRFFFFWVSYYANQIVIDAKHLTMISAQLLVKDNTEIFDLDEIVKMSVQKTGIVCNLCNKGDVHIETSNDDIKIIHNLKNPHRFVKVFEKYKASGKVNASVGIFSS